MKTQEFYKRMKKEIVENTAIEVGYHSDVLNAIPPYAIVKAHRELCNMGSIPNNASDMDVENRLVTESVKWTNFEDFKTFAHYFFSFNRED